MKQEIVSLQILKKIPYPYQGSHFISAQYEQVSTSGHCDIVVTDVLQGRILPYRSSTPLYMHRCTREGCGLGPHMTIYIKCTTIKARAANKRSLT